jgi:hypothetical protein
MSAIADSTDGPVDVVKVLFALFPGYNTLDVAGPLEVLSRSLHDPKNKCKQSIHSLGELQLASGWPIPIGPLLTFLQPAKPSTASSWVRHLP